jgi:two-component system NtrC family sensor kinase
MRVALKLMVVFLGLLVTVLALEGWQRLRREREVVERDIAHEQRLLGRALRPSVRLALRAGDLRGAEELLQVAEEGEAEVGIRLVALGPDGVGTAPAVRAPLTGDARKEATHVDRTNEPGTVYTYVPLGDDAPGTAIELAEPLAKAEARIRQGAMGLLWTTLAVAFGAAWLAVLVGNWIVGRPVRDLVARTEEIAAGSLDVLPRTRRRDELGHLHSAIAKMVDRLREARAAAERETEARLEAERRLRHGERLAAVGTLAAGVAHELGTPLQVVAGRARMIEEAKETPADLRRHARIVRTESKRMERIVRSLLSLSRPRDQVRRPVAMGTLVAEVVEHLGPNAEKAGVHIEAAIDESVTVLGDRDHLAQLLTNLVQNGVQAMPEGGRVAVRLSRSSPLEPPPDVPPHEGYVRIDVHDEGVGIPPELQDEIFDPFFTTKDVGQGTGLGLSVAFVIAREHDGWLALDSAPSAGTTLSVLLPVATEASP